MATFRDLPIEITTAILKQAWEASLTTQFQFPSQDLLAVAGLKPSYKSPRVESYAIPDRPGYTLFAFKAARVCSLWRDIVSTWRDAWDLVVFDLQDDPAPFLDVFTWSGDRTISVYVFNSIPRSIDPEEEIRRVIIICKLIIPNVRRCKSIWLDVLFPGSLPPPLWFFFSGSTSLATLNLEALVPGNHVDFPLDTNPLSFGPFPRLARLSLTGFAIMEIGWDFPGWIQALEGGPRLQSLKISNFTFRSEVSDSPDGLGRSTLQFFVSMLSRINPTRLHLVAMSLSPDSTPRTIPRTYNLSDVYIHFEASSGPFLVDFLSWIQGGIHQSLMITGTETIPHFDTALFGKTLTLHTIPDSASLRAILENFWGETLVFDNCDGFDNTLIQWLSQPDGIQREERANFIAKMLNYIRINSCTNFTSNALRRLVEVRHVASRGNEAALGTIVAMNIDVLNVTGTAPVLEPNDQSWFTMNPDVVEVTWYREEPDSYSMYMFDNIQD